MVYATRLAAVFLIAVVCEFPSCAFPATATLDLHTASGEKTFRIGERIPLRLTLSSSDDVSFDTPALVSSTRGDEFDCNFFTASPVAGWSDPLSTYFKQNLLLEGHGWPGHPLTRAHPIEVILDLNQWVRFDQPGDYKVDLASYCIYQTRGNVRLTVTESIHLHVVAASADWQSQKLKEIQERRVYSQPGIDELARESASSDLRYLATPEGFEEMTLCLRELNDSSAHECSMGLAGLPRALRQTAIDSMNRRIEDPSFPVSSLFFTTLSFLHVEPGSDEKSIEEQRDTIIPVVWSKIYSAVWNKDQRARAQTIQTLLRHQSDVQVPEVESKVPSLVKALP